MTYEQQFRKTVLDFMERTGYTFYRLNKEAGYNSATKLKDYFQNGNGTITVKLASKIMNIIEDYENN